MNSIAKAWPSVPPIQSPPASTVTVCTSLAGRCWLDASAGRSPPTAARYPPPEGMLSGHGDRRPGRPTRSTTSGRSRRAADGRRRRRRPRRPRVGRRRRRRRAGPSATRSATSPPSTSRSSSPSPIRRRSRRAATRRSPTPPGSTPPDPSSPSIRRDCSRGGADARAELDAAFAGVDPRATAALVRTADERPLVAHRPAHGDVGPRRRRHRRLRPAALGRDATAPRRPPRRGHAGVELRGAGFDGARRPTCTSCSVSPDGARWTWGDASSPDRIEGPAVDFCLAVTQRRPLDELALRATPGPAADWLAVAQAFAGAATTTNRA